MRGTREQKMEVYTEWYYSEDRIPQKELAIKIGVSDSTLTNWGKKLEDDDGDFTQAEITAFKRRLFRDAMSKDSTAKDKELTARMLGVLIDKKEEKITFFNGDEHFRQNREAKKFLEQYESGGDESGVDEMRDERPILLDEVRLHPEQEHGEDGEVASVGVSSGLAETIQRIRRTDTV